MEPQLAKIAITLVTPIVGLRCWQHRRHRRKRTLLLLRTFFQDPNGSLAEVFLMTLLHMAHQFLRHQYLPLVRETSPFH